MMNEIEAEEANYDIDATGHGRDNHNAHIQLEPSHTIAH